MPMVGGVSEENAIAFEDSGGDGNCPGVSNGLSLLDPWKEIFISVSMSR